ncbi:MAG: hypothetical protein WCP29_15020 [Acidobacteriota bacterium]
MRLAKSATGVSLVETAAALAVSAVVAGAAVPAIQDYITQARFTRAIQDAHTIATAVARFEGDVLGQQANPRGWATFDLLVGAGVAPSIGTGGDPKWLRPTGSAMVGALDDQLVTNAVGYSTFPPRQANWIRGWHGPYLESGIGPDPWGRRYAINIRTLSTGASCTVVISAGPNGLIETPFEGVVIVPGGDDVVALVAPPR